MFRTNCEKKNNVYTYIHRKLFVKHQFSRKKKTERKSQLSNDLLTMKRVVLS